MDRPEAVIALGGMAMVILGLAQFIRDMLKTMFASRDTQAKETEKLKDELRNLQTKLDRANSNIEKYRHASLEARATAKKYYLLYKGCVDGKSVQKPQ